MDDARIVHAGDDNSPKRWESGSMAAPPETTVDVAALDPLAALRASAPSGLRRIAPFVAVAVAAGAVVIAAPRLIDVFSNAIVRALHADARWVVAGVAFELLSFAGYIALFWHVAERANPRIGLRASAEVSLAGAAATRLLPTAGAGGAALTWWSLRRAGQPSGDATRTLLTFLVLLYSVFLGSLLVAALVLTANGQVPLALSGTVALGVAAAIGVALALALHHHRGRSNTFGAGVVEAVRVAARPHPRLLGALAWWSFDMLVLWAVFNAFGTPPAPEVLVLGYFLGQVANTIPLPGAASGGMVAIFLALGMPATVVLPSVLAYRAIAIWTPVPFGATALAGLRRTVKTWAMEDAAGDESAGPDPVARRRSPAPALARAASCAGPRQLAA
jgi:uncharacterized membrane protein YbhN (UPF0104 family)